MSDFVRNKINHYVKTLGPKHWYLGAKKDVELIAVMNDSGLVIPDDASFAEQVYANVVDEDIVCSNGGRRRLISLEAGWRFCGRAKQCECARQSVANSVSEAFSKKDNISKETIKQKRAMTNILRYGVENVGQIESSKQSHKAFYADKEKVKLATNKHKATMLKRHGVNSPFKVDHIRKLGVQAIQTEEYKAACRARTIVKAETGYFLEVAYKNLSQRIFTTGYRLITPYECYNGLNKHQYYDFECLNCKILFKDYIFGSKQVPVCRVCNPYIPKFQSHAELEVKEFIETYGIYTLGGQRNIIDGSNKELDIYIPSLKIAIEYCGLYWHGEFNSGKTRNYHREKYDRCLEKDIRLITIFEDEWIHSKDIVKNRLKNILKLEKSSVVYARNTTVRQIELSLCNDFLNQHHIQGSIRGIKYASGLFQDNDLVGVMACGSERTFVGAGDTSQWELLRLAFSKTVVGGSSKLFKSFIKSENPSVISTYCDLRWGTGKVYVELGFLELQETKPGYWWCDLRSSKRYHRYTFNKRRLVEQGNDPALTEIEIMRKLNYDRIWDCGNKKFIWTKP